MTEKEDAIIRAAQAWRREFRSQYVNGKMRDLAEAVDAYNQPEPEIEGLTIEVDGRVPPGEVWIRQAEKIVGKIVVTRNDVEAVIKAALDAAGEGK